MKILIVEPYLVASHAAWLTGLHKNITHEIRSLTLSAKHWKWRMHGGSIALAKKFMVLTWQPDLVIASDMMDLSVFLALTRTKMGSTPVLLYFHENQVTYPISAQDTDTPTGRDNHYAFINYTSALAANHLIFNSAYHRDDFLAAIPTFLRQFPSGKQLANDHDLRLKSSVIAPGFDAKAIDTAFLSKDNSIPLIVWNHRWEYDKNPLGFFDAVQQLVDDKIPFQLVLLGKRFAKISDAYIQAEQNMAPYIVFSGHVQDTNEYYQWLWKSDIAVSTSHHEYYGISTVEAIYADCFPILPNRLAYPSLIPSSFKDKCLYNTTSELFTLLKNACLDKHQDHSVLQAHVKQDCYRNLAEKYEVLFKQYM